MLLLLQLHHHHMTLHQHLNQLQFHLRMKTEPSGSMVTTVATTELVTEESTTTGPVTEESLPTDPVTEDSTSPGQVSGNVETIFVAPAPTLTEQPVDPNIPTETMLLLHQNVSNPRTTNIILPLILEQYHHYCY